MNSSPYLLKSQTPALKRDKHLVASFWSLGRELLQTERPRIRDQISCVPLRSEELRLGHPSFLNFQTCIFQSGLPLRSSIFLIERRVDLTGFEPVISSLQMKRISQLCYRPGFKLLATLYVVKSTKKFLTLSIYFYEEPFLRRQ
jgi:hypothetical protein